MLRGQDILHDYRCIMPWLAAKHICVTSTNHAHFQIPGRTRTPPSPPTPSVAKMSRNDARGFRKILQDAFYIDDEVWSYQVPDLPHSLTDDSPRTDDSKELVKSISVVSNNEKLQLVLSFQPLSPNRAVSSHPLDKFISISFAGFRSQVLSTNSGSANERPQPATPREFSDYTVRLLRAGISLNTVHYNFYGHSNSQLKSRSCFLFADSKENIRRMVESLGDFTKIKTVAKKAKRIGLLFSSAEVVMTLDPSRCQDIPDVETNDYIFTDGCGLISGVFAQELARRRKIVFRESRYTPSVYQIRYRGYKGVLMLDPTMTGEYLVKFRKSMKKFSGGDDHSFSVVEYSKVIPHVFFYSNYM